MKIDNETALDRGLWNAIKSTSTVIAVALGTAFAAVPAQADSGFENAHSLRSLDIMLMVTALRCRKGPHDFQGDYHRFSAKHLNDLNAASRTLKRTFAASYGEKNPARALDRMGVKIANSYGDGHPWLTCAELQQVTRDLSQSPDAADLAVNARYLLSASRPQTEPTPQVAQNDDLQISYNMTAEWEQRP
ncbi:S-adenosyl-L-homocysteine hydrolase [uncultured Erythrobacter sp.]|uniref:S-adenosyl-L-homocysteine hydrolase n=1 Tax=uncultured Erythrobacter sp. TaxID=263913 RepID=UPI0026160173|nr:S-adenosyl-L-homocysteine hydrolase [uncultured Erythrobacter sp.]